MRVLLIEDDLIEIMKFEKTLKGHDPGHSMVSVKNGEEAIDFLAGNMNAQEIFGNIYTKRYGIYGV